MSHKIWHTHKSSHFLMDFMSTLTNIWSIDWLNLVKIHWEVTGVMTVPYFVTHAVFNAIKIIIEKWLELFTVTLVTFWWDPDSSTQDGTRTRSIAKWPEILLTTPVTFPWTIFFDQNSSKSKDHWDLTGSVDVPDIMTPCPILCHPKSPSEFDWKKSVTILEIN